MARYVLAAAIVVMLVVVAGGTVWWMYTRQPVADPTPLAGPSSAPASCGNPTLKVAAAPEMVPVIEAAALSLNPGGGTCGPIRVSAEEPVDTLANLKTQKPDVWIPSSSAWLRMPGGDTFDGGDSPLARTPIVLAAPTAITGLFAKGDQTSWAQLAAGAAGDKIPAVTMPDAQRSTVGMLSVYAVNQAMTRTTTDTGIAQLRALTLRSRLKDANADPAALLRKVQGEWNANAVVYDVGAFPVTEQQFLAYQRAKHTVQLQAAFPVDGLIEADYPYAIATKTKHKELAQKLRTAITGASLTEAGFRAEAMPRALTLPKQVESLLAPAKMWADYRQLNFQVLLLIDASGSMNQQIKDKTGRTTTRAELLRGSGKTAAQLFGADTSIGMWFFSEPTKTSPAHTEAVPFGPITAEIDGKPRREMLAASIGAYRAENDAGTPLYQAVLDGQKEMQSKVKPDAVTLMVVLTDGEDGESRFKMPGKDFLAKLAAQRDPARPVPIIGVGYGPDANMAALGAMATATGGQAIPATNPADLSSAMARAFLAAHAPQ
ncbi:MAG: hypothetical protein ABW046_22870 [Actinoplanes sp.]